MVERPWRDEFRGGCRGATRSAFPLGSRPSWNGPRLSCYEMRPSPGLSHGSKNVDMPERVGLALHWIAMTMDALGAIIIVVGAVASTALFVSHGLGHEWQDAVRRYRANLGRAILLGFDFLVGAVIIGAAQTPTAESLGTLALIVAVRTFFSFSFGVEREGQWPWRATRKLEGGR